MVRVLAITIEQVVKLLAAVPPHLTSTLGKYIAPPNLTVPPPLTVTLLALVRGLIVNQNAVQKRRRSVDRRGGEVNRTATDGKARIPEQYEGHACAGDGSAINIYRCIIEKVCSWGKSYRVSGRHR